MKLFGVWDLGLRGILRLAKGNPGYPYLGKSPHSSVLRTVLGGSWTLISRVISTLNKVLSRVALLTALLISTHESQSRGLRASGGLQVCGCPNSKAATMDWKNGWALYCRAQNMIVLKPEYRQPMYSLPNLPKPSIPKPSTLNPKPGFQGVMKPWNS